MVTALSTMATGGRRLGREVFVAGNYQSVSGTDDIRRVHNSPRGGGRISDPDLLMLFGCSLFRVLFGVNFIGFFQLFGLIGLLGIWILIFWACSILFGF